MRAHFVIPRQRRIGNGVARCDDAKLGEAIEPGKLGKMFSGLESLDLGGITKPKPRSIYLSDGCNAWPAGAQGFFELRDGIADARQHTNARDDHAAHC